MEPLDAGLGPCQGPGLGGLRVDGRVGADKGMLADVRPAHALLRILGQETLQEVLELRVHATLPRHRVADNLVDQLEDAVGVEGRLADIDFVQDAPKRPQVRRTATPCQSSSNDSL